MRHRSAPRGPRLTRTQPAAIAALGLPPVLSSPARTPPAPTAAGRPVAGAVGERTTADDAAGRAAAPLGFAGR